MNASRNYSSAPEFIILGHSQKVAGLERRTSLRLNSINQEVAFSELEKEDRPLPLPPECHSVFGMFWSIHIGAWLSKL